MGGLRNSWFVIQRKPICSNPNPGTANSIRSSNSTSSSNHFSISPIRVKSDREWEEYA